MIRNIKDITIQGGCYGDGTTLEGLFENRFNIVYGRNGSGKSTIARAVQSIVDSSTQPTSSQTSTISASFNESLSSDESNNIHVFNEDFIDKNIRIKGSDSLGAIVMAGSQVGLDSQIQEIEGKLANARQELEDLKGKAPGLNEDYNTSVSEITNKLKIGGYADRGRDIKGLERRINVSGPGDVEKYRHQVGGLNQTDLQEQIKENIKRLSATYDDTQITWTNPQLPTAEQFNNADKLLGTALEQPELDEHDSIIAKVASNEYLHHYMHDAQIHFGEEELDFCPLCQRPITPDFTEELMKRIAMVLDKNTENHKNDLDRCISTLGNVDCGQLPVEIFENESNACSVTVNKLNDFLGSIRERLEKKKESPYKALELLDGVVFNNLIEQCNDAFGLLNQKITKRSQDIAARKDLIKATTILNEKLACMECEQLFVARDKAKRLLDDNTEAINGLEKKTIPEYSNSLRSLKQKVSNTGIAVKLINNLLLTVFCGDNRLMLDDNDGNGYKLLSHNVPVSPDAVSTGERNVIALAYFFAAILEGQSEKSGYSTEMLLVIDDPVSSFDQSNRYGIISMLTNRIRSVLADNFNSKVLFLTHDLQTLNDLVNVRKKLHCDRIKIDGYTKDLPAYLFLTDHKLIKKDDVRSDDYLERMRSVFNYAKEDVVTYDDTIGNQIRRLMESYVSFMYRKGVDETLADNHILDGVPDKLQDMFKDLPARLMLNKSSHAQQFEDTPISEYEVLSPDELHRLARRLLLFVFYTNPNHLYACLRNDFYIVRDWSVDEERSYGVESNESESPGENSSAI